MTVKCLTYLICTKNHSENSSKRNNQASQKCQSRIEQY